MKTMYALAGVLGVIAAMGGIGPARADVVITCQQSNVQAGSGALLGCSQGGVNTGAENVLFNDAASVSSGKTLVGVSQTTQTLVDFTSSESLSVNNGVGGVATISSADGFVNNLSYSLDPNQVYGSTFDGFSVLDTNLDTTHASGTVTFTINALDSGGNAEQFQTVAFNLTQGGNKFEFTAINNELITSVSYVSNDVNAVTVETVKQNQFTFANGTPCVPGAPGCVVNPPVLPEPGSMMLLGSGLLGMAALIRRRRNA